MKTYFSNKMSWSTFKKISDDNNKANNEQGPYPMHIDRVLWNMLRNRQIYVGLDKKDIFISVKKPSKNAKWISTLPTEREVHPLER